MQQIKTGSTCIWWYKPTRNWFIGDCTDAGKKVGYAYLQSDLPCPYDNQCSTRLQRLQCHQTCTVQKTLKSFQIWNLWNKFDPWNYSTWNEWKSPYGLWRRPSDGKFLPDVSVSCKYL